MTATRLIRINGFNYGLDGEGRFRNNWQTKYRNFKRRGHNLPRTCERCFSKSDLTIDHEPPLRVAEFKGHRAKYIGKKTTLCKRCHSKKNKRERVSMPPYIKKCEKLHPQYFTESYGVPCIICRICQTKKWLSLIKDKEYILT